jgi:hypothetical protein
MEKGRTMVLLFAVEASQPNGTMFRLAFGCSLLPLVSWVASFTRLF